MGNSSLNSSANSNNGIDFNLPTVMPTTSNESLTQKTSYSSISDKPKKLNRHSTGEDVLRKYSNTLNAENGSIPVDGLIGKVCVVTGGNSGLGFETIRVLLLGGVKRVYLCCRNTDLATTTLETSKILFAEKVIVLELNLLSLPSIKACADEILRREMNSNIDILVCNAGIMAPPKLIRNEYGWESQMATNHMGHFYFTNLLLPKMKAQLTRSRIVVVASMYHVSAKLYISDMHFNRPNNTYSPWKAYANSKLANVLFVKALATRLEDTQVTAVALHPGIVSTGLFRHVLPEKGLRPLIFKQLVADKTVPQGAATTIFACAAPEVSRMSGCYLDNCAKANDMLSFEGKDADCSRREDLWRETKHQVQQAVLQLALQQLSALPSPKPASPCTLTFQACPTHYSDEEDDEDCD